jgi:hypothetical protein
MYYNILYYISWCILQGGDLLHAVSTVDYCVINASVQAYTASLNPCSYASIYRDGTMGLCLDTCPECPEHPEQHPSDTVWLSWTGSVGSSLQGGAGQTVVCCDSVRLCKVLCGRRHKNGFQLIKCMHLLPSLLYIHILCSLDRHLDRFLSGICLFYSEIRYRTAYIA